MIKGLNKAYLLNSSMKYVWPLVQFIMQVLFNLTYIIVAYNVM